MGVYRKDTARSGVANTINKHYRPTQRTKYRFGNCRNEDILFIMVGTETIKKALLDLNSESIKTRFIPEIIKET